jgi:predicted esterase
VVPHSLFPVPHSAFVPGAGIAIAAIVGLAGCPHARSVSLAEPTDASTAVATIHAAATTTAAPASTSAAPEAGLRPLAGDFESLAVAGHPDAQVALPTGATERRPVVVVVHGTGDRPDWQCEGWRSATAQFPFVVCPTGFHDKHWSKRGDTRYTHIGGAPLLAYIDASLAALAARYPDYADTRAPILAGFSLGAREILTLAVKNPARFPCIVLVEGASTAWTPARLATYVKGGGKRVLYGSGQAGVHLSQQRSAKRLMAAGLDVRVVYAPVGHTFDQPLVYAVRAEVPWLVGGDERWERMAR